MLKERMEWTGEEVLLTFEGRRVEHMRCTKERERSNDMR